MQETSALYRQILATEPHWFETSVVIGESGDLVTEYGDKILFGGTAIIVSRDSPDSGFREERLMSVRTSIQMFNDGIEIGKAISQEIEITMIKPSASDFPTMALIAPYVRVCSEDATSEWIKQGVFYIDTRSFSDNDSESGLVTLTFHGYDAMLMTEQYYTDTGNLDWSSGTVVDTDMVSDIARIIGVGVDERTWDIMTSGYRVPLPASYTLREILGYIASMYVGCFIMTEEGLLRLVSVLELPPETNYLIDNAGDAITFGIDRQGSEVTVSGGAIASFETEGVCEISELIATIEPKQDLHGYDNPWVGGSGKNLINQDGTNTDNGYVHKSYINTSGTISQADGNWDVMEYVPVEPNTTYTLSGTTANNVNGYAEYNESKTRVANGVVNTSPYTFTTGASTRYVRFNRQYSTDTQVQLEKGSSATTYAPYANECPITGWTGLSGQRCGVNIGEFTHGKGVDTGGHIHDFATRSATVTPIKIDSTRQYKYVNSNSGAGIYAVWNGETLVRRVAGMASGTVMNTSGGDSLYVCGYSGAGDVLPETCGVFFADQYEEFEPYKGDPITVSWQDEAGTVHCGTIDLISGVLSVTHLFKRYTGQASENWAYSSWTQTLTYAFYSNVACAGAIGNNTGLEYCNELPITDYNGLRHNDVPAITFTGGSLPSIRVPKELVSSGDSAGIRAFLAEHPLEIVYRLATPQTYQLTPQQLNTFAEQNNIIVDTGNIEEVKYLIPTSEVTRILV